VVIITAQGYTLTFGGIHGGNKMNIQPKDTSQGHFWVSIVKSLIRIAACFALFLGNYAIAAIGLAVAELLGIGEELV
jgi:hypothetical protein